MDETIKFLKFIERFFWGVMAFIAIAALMTSCGTYRPNYASAGAAAVSGASWGVREKLKSNNAAFFKAFPNASKNYWSENSWLNKYNQRSPELGRNKTPIWITDGWHLTGTVSQVSAFSSGAFIATKRREKKWHYFLDFGICFASYTSFNYITHDIILK